MKLVPGILAVLFAVSGWAQEKPRNADIENIGRRAINRGQINLISADKETALGKQLAAEYETKVQLAADPALNAYIDRVGQNIVVNSDANVPVKFKVVQSDDFDAQAFPGAFVYISTGTIVSADNEAELAFVLGQQIAHIAARHTTESLSKMQLVNYSNIPLITSVGQGTGNMVPLGFLQMARAQVTEADYLGLQYLYKAGYDPGEAVTFLQRIEAAEQTNPSSASRVFRQTPPVQDRIEATQKNIATILPVRSRNTVTTPEFEQIKAELKRK